MPVFHKLSVSLISDPLYVLFESADNVIVFVPEFAVVVLLEHDQLRDIDPVSLAVKVKVGV